MYKKTMVIAVSALIVLPIAAAQKKKEYNDTTIFGSSVHFADVGQQGQRELIRTLTLALRNSDEEDFNNFKALLEQNPQIDIGEKRLTLFEPFGELLTALKPAASLLTMASFLGRIDCLEIMLQRPEAQHAKTESLQALERYENQGMAESQRRMQGWFGAMVDLSGSYVAEGLVQQASEEKSQEGDNADEDDIADKDLMRKVLAGAVAGGIEATKKHLAEELQKERDEAARVKRERIETIKKMLRSAYV